MDSDAVNKFKFTYYNAIHFTNTIQYIICTALLVCRQATNQKRWMDLDCAIFKIFSMLTEQLSIKNKHLPVPCNCHSPSVTVLNHSKYSLTKDAWHHHPLPIWGLIFTLSNWNFLPPLNWDFFHSIKLILIACLHTAYSRNRMQVCWRNENTYLQNYKI